MSFTDLTFLFGFFPVVWLLYQPLCKKFGQFANLYIFAASMIFYAWGSIRQLIVLLLLCGFNFFACLQMEKETDPDKRKWQLIAAVAINLLTLFYYRYLGVWFGFLDDMIGMRLSALPALMPVGLSFYIFSSLSALQDVYHKKAPACHDFIDFGIYTAFFGRVNMGPIANYAQMEPQLHSHPVTAKKNARGMALFIQGLFAKAVIADNLALLYSSMAGDTSWLGTLLFGFAYFFELYFDFMGYSRMARGLGSLFGFTIPENFNLPYTALSVQDFWRRWHISLTSWFREYVYIPLGGNRVSETRWMLNIAAVWLLTGLWHGAIWTFLIWGIYQGVLIVLEKKWLNQWLEVCPDAVRHIYLVITQLIGWTFFSSAAIGPAFAQIGRYFGIGSSAFASQASLFSLCQSLLLLAASIWLASGFSKKAAAWIAVKTRNSWWIWQIAGYTAAFVLDRKSVV